MTLTKAHIIENVSMNNGYSKTRSTHLVESVLQIVKNTLVSGEDGRLRDVLHIFTLMENHKTFCS
jgi:nucleoid DNA-binding protein